MKLSIAALQTPGHPGDVEQNLVELTTAAHDAVAEGAELLITPEMFVTGYNLPREQLVELAAEDLESRLVAIAQQTGIALLAGVPLLENGELLNAAVLVTPDGQTLLRYVKTHLYADLDRTLFRAGDARPPVVEYRGVKIGVMICYDVEFPENVRAAALAGAHAVLVPTAQMEPFAFLAEQLVRVRAWESQLYLAYVNHTGAEGELRYVGRSSIISPSGEVLAAASAESAELLFATIDTELVDAGRAEYPYLDDRRPELYQR